MSLFTAFDGGSVPRYDTTRSPEIESDAIIPAWPPNVPTAMARGGNESRAVHSSSMSRYTITAPACDPTSRWCTCALGSALGAVYGTQQHAGYCSRFCDRMVPFSRRQMSVRSASTM